MSEARSQAPLHGKGRAAIDGAKIQKTWEGVAKHFTWEIEPATTTDVSKRGASGRQSRG
jgi:hypothetical protein